MSETTIEEIGERYESVGLARRLGILMRGIGKPHGTRAYKEARIELQRLAAPLAAVVSVALFVVVLIVVTAVTSQRRESISVTVATLEPDDTPDIEELPDEPDEPPEVDMTQEVVDLAVPSDLPQPPAAAPAPTPARVPPGEVRKALAAPSPVTMAAVPGTRTKTLGDGVGGFGTQIADASGGAGGLPEGALLGEIIDLKRNAKGEDRTAALGNLAATDDYWMRVGEMFRGRFSDAACRNVYRIPKRVALTHVWIPPQSAENGPRAFGAESLMEPKYWVAHYAGTLTPTKRMRCRFFGYFDDCMVVAIDGKVVLDVFWAMQADKASPTTGWRTKDPAASKWPAPQTACAMMAGDWIDFEAGKPVQLDIVFGEKPGGALGGLLCIEEQGVEYERMPNGRPKWPIFTTVPLSMRQKLTLEEEPYGIGTNPPRFNYKPKVSARAQMEKSDVGVDVNI